MTYTLNELKVAVINKDLKKIEEFSDKEPQFSSIEEAKEFISYLEKAKKLLNSQKLKLKQEMKKIQELKKYNLENQISNFSLKS